MSANNATVIANITNNCSQGITLNGFNYPFASNYNQPVAHGNPPVVAQVIRPKQTVAALNVTGPGSSETAGKVTFNMPNCAILQISWDIKYNDSKNTSDDPIVSLVSGSGYNIDQTWAVSEVNVFTGTITISEHS